MAESLSTGIVKVVVERPLSEAYEKIKSALVDFKSNMESLQNTRTTIEAVLLDADSMVDRSSSHTQQDALKKLSCQLDRLVDLLDAREARAMRKQVMGGSWFIKEACLFFSPSNQLVARFMDAWRVKDIRNQLDSISRDHAQFGSIVNVAQTIQRASSHVITDMLQDSNNLIHMPTGLGRLTELRMLDMFVVSKQSYRSEANAIGGLADLEKLNNIEGGLTIKVRRESKDIAPEARAANLKMKDKLTQFYIEFEYSTKEDEMVLEGLHPHANLKFLEIKGYGGE
ncbi:hypothetical protein BVRB_7g177510, partial [Beta vulgaris subsp. vulgaris]